MLERGPSGTRRIESERLPASEVNEAEILEGSVVDDNGDVVIPGSEVAIPNRDLVPVEEPTSTETTPYVDIQPIVPPEKAPLKFTVVGLDMNRDAKDFARDVADKRVTERLDASLEKGNWFKRTAMSLYNNIRRDNMRQTEIRKATREIEDTNDVLVGLVGSEDDRANARRGLFKRWQNTEYGDEVIKKAAGEHRDIHEEDSPLTTGVRGAFEAALGSTDPKAREVFEAEVSRLFGQQLDADPANKGEGNVRINNALENLDAMKLAIEQGATQQEVMAGLEVISGEARTGARTEARYDLIDKTMEKLGKLGIVGNILPEAAVATLAASAMGIAKFLGGSAAAKIVGVTIPGVVGGLIAGGREFRHLTLEKRQDAREHAMGGEIDPGDKRRQKIREKGGYDVEETSDTIDFLNQRLQEITRTEDGEKPGDKALEAALEALAVAEFRNNFKGKDLLRSSGFVNGDGEVEDFAIVRAKLKIALRKELDPDTRTRLDLLEPPADIDDLIVKQSFESEKLAKLETSMSDADKAFLKWQLMQSGKAGLVGGSFGLGGALISQEVFAMLPFNTPVVPILNVSLGGESQTGLVEQLWKDTPDGTHQTLLADFFGPDYGGHHAAAGEYLASQIGADNKGSIRLSADHNLQKNPDGTLKFVDRNGQTTIDNIKVNPDGSLPAESQKALRDIGMDVREMQPTAGERISVTETKEVPLSKYMEHHPGTPIDRIHMDYGTSGTYERAEQGLHAGLVSPDGTYNMNISNMDKDSHDLNGNRVNWSEEAQQGKMKLAISPSKEFQGTPIMVDIQADGRVSVPPGHPAAPFLTTGPDGKTVVTGAYAEAGRMGAIDPATGKAKFDVVATVVGKNEAGSGLIQDTVKTEKQVMHPNYKITTGGYEGPHMETDLPIWIPLVPIKSMKPVQERPPTVAGAPPVEPLAPQSPVLEQAPGRLELEAAPIPAAIAAADSRNGRVIRRGGEEPDVLGRGAYRIGGRRPISPRGSTRPSTSRQERGPRVYRSRGVGREYLYSQDSQFTSMPELTAGGSQEETKETRPQMTRQERETLIGGVNAYTETLSADVMSNRMSERDMKAQVQKRFGKGGYRIKKRGDRFEIKVNGQGLAHFRDMLSVA